MIFSFIFTCLSLYIFVPDKLDLAESVCEGSSRVPGHAPVRRCRHIDDGAAATVLVKVVAACADHAVVPVKVISEWALTPNRPCARTFWRCICVVF